MAYTVYLLSPCLLCCCRSGHKLDVWRMKQPSWSSCFQMTRHSRLKCTPRSRRKSFAWGRASYIRWRHCFRLPNGQSAQGVDHLNHTVEGRQNKAKKNVIKVEIQNRFNLISERVKVLEQNSENLMKIGWKFYIRKLWVMTLWSFANFTKHFWKHYDMKMIELMMS